MMTTKLILIAVTAAAFGLGFAEVVERAGNPIRQDSSWTTCQDLGGDACTRMVERQAH